MESSAKHQRRQFACTGVANVHFKQRPHRCSHPGCLAAFGRRSNLDSHFRTVHQKQRPYCCKHTDCGATFGKKTDLVIHVKTVHLKQQEFCCGYCPTVFGIKSNLAKHINIVHLEHRAYQCGYADCPRSFGRKGDLDTHVKVVHLEQRDHVCSFPLCGQRFGTKNNLNAHLKAMHSEEGQQHQKREEQKVAKALEEAGIKFKREHRVSFECWDDTFARLDFVIVKDGCVLFSEVDEGQHGWYGTECEVSRMTKIHAACVVEGNTLPMGIIRYNPHAFRVDRQLRRISTKDRLAKLVDVIRNWQCDPQGGLQVQYMYYDCFTVDGGLVLNIWDDDYNQEVRACCRDPII